VFWESGRSHVQQLIALVLSPYSLLPRKQHSTLVNNNELDPFSHTSRRVSQQALALLKAWIATYHPKYILRALPRYEGDGEEEEREEEDVEDSDVGDSEDAAMSRNGKGKRKPSRGWAEEDNDCQVTLAGERVSRCADLWDILAGHAGEMPRVKPNTREKAIGEEWGWELAEVLIAGYARDAQLHDG
jgi:hypothetical protein